MKKTGGLLYEPDSVDKLADNDIVTIYNAINMVSLRAANPGVSDEELKSNLKLLLTYADGRTSYYTAGQRIITYIYPGRGGDGHRDPTGDKILDEAMELIPNSPHLTIENALARIARKGDSWVEKHFESLVERAFWKGKRTGFCGSCAKAPSRLKTTSASTTCACASAKRGKR